MEMILRQYIDMEVERLTNNIVHKAVLEKVSKQEYNSSHFFQEKNDKSDFSYNTIKLNQMKMDITQYVQNVLFRLDDGIIEDSFLTTRFKTSRFRNLKNGILCDISIGSIRNSTLFANVGPTIPIKLIFTGQIHSDVDIKVKEYGINNVMVQVYLVITVQEQVSMPLTSKQKEITVRTPISMDIIKGDVPNYYGGHFS